MLSALLFAIGAADIAQSRPKAVNTSVLGKHGIHLSLGLGTKHGLGLGLYIASEIARAHDGSLQVASTSEETTFAFTMPLKA